MLLYKNKRHVDVFEQFWCLILLCIKKIKWISWLIFREGEKAWLYCQCFNHLHWVHQWQSYTILSLRKALNINDNHWEILRKKTSLILWLAFLFYILTILMSVKVILKIMYAEIQTKLNLKFLLIFEKTFGSLNCSRTFSQL